MNDTYDNTPSAADLAVFAACRQIAKLKPDWAQPGMAAWDRSSPQRKWRVAQRAPDVWVGGFNRAAGIGPELVVEGVFNHFQLDNTNELTIDQRDCNRRYDLLKADDPRWCDATRSMLRAVQSGPDPEDGVTMDAILQSLSPARRRVTQDAIEKAGGVFADRSLFILRAYLDEIASWSAD